jgi:glycosyltransferase involved in cell wall biosynthesis
MVLKKIIFYYYCNLITDTGLNRINLIADGFRAFKISVIVNILGIQKNKSPYGVNNNNHLGNTSFFTFVPSIISLVYSIISVIKESKKKSTIVFIVPSNFVFFSFVTFLFFLFKVKIISEKLEEFDPPFFLKGFSKISSIVSSFITKKTFTLFDMVFTITDQLYEDCKKYNKNSKKIYPAIVDYKYYSTFKNSKYLGKLNYPYICYAGHLIEGQNGALSLLMGFKELNRIYKNKVYLIYIGGKSDPNYNFYINKCKELNLENRVIFTNYLRKDNLRKVYQYATILSILKPFNKRNTKNFPGKLAEYLSTGVPVIASSVGDMGKFLKDNTSAFLVNDLSPTTIGKKLKFILKNKILREKVGKTGKTHARGLDKILIAKQYIRNLSEL